MNLPVNLLNQSKWRRWILNICWMLTGFYCIGEFVIILMLLAESKELVHYVLRFPLPTAAFMTSIIGLLEWCSVRFRDKNLDYVFIVAASLVAGALVYANLHLDVMKAMLFLPICLSVIYFNKTKILAATLVNIVLAVFSYRNLPLGHDEIVSMLTVVMMMMACSAIGMLVVLRGSEVLQNLERTIHAEIQMRQKAELIDSLSKKDALTGLFNHKSFHEHLDQQLAQSGRAQAPLQLALLDIDNFKSINDMYGHWVGDIVLQRVGWSIKELTEQEGFVARYGGEEFAIVFSGYSEVEVYQMLETVRKKIASLHFAELEGRGVSVSIGLHQLQTNENKEIFFKLTDGALYQAKRSGKNKIVVA